MALPTPDKQWIFKSFQLLSTGDIQNDWKQFYLALLYHWTSTTGWVTQAGATTTNSNPWTVSASSNGTVANTRDNITQIIGTNTSASVDTSSNYTIRIRNVLGGSHWVFTVTQGASTPKTTIVSDLNTAFAGAGLSVRAQIVGTNQLALYDPNSTTNGYIGIDTVANGCTLSTAVGWPSSGTSTLAQIMYTNPNYSWYVLRQAAINPLFEVCVGLQSGNSPHLWTASISMNTGFSLGGTLGNTIPTALDQWVYWTNICPNQVNYNTFNTFVVIAMSTDGQCTRIFSFVNNAFRSFFLFDKPKNPIAAWTNPAIAFLGANGAPYTEFNDVAYIMGRVNNMTFWNYGTTEFFIDAAVGQRLTVRNQLTGEWQMTPIGLASTTSGAQGRHGEIFDLWYGSVNLQLGMTFPGTTTRDFIYLPNIIHPWNQSVLVTA